MRAALALCVLLAPALSGCVLFPGDDAVLRIGSTTSTHDSGLLDFLLPRFEADTGVKARAIVAGTGEVLEKGKRGDLDVLLTHSTAREEDFVRAGHGLDRTTVMYNRYLLVGPRADPAEASARDAVVESLRHIAAGQHPFVSRGDRSGTHDRELDLWRAAGLEPRDPSAPWYKETGAGQAQTLLVANERGAYTLTDEATWAQLDAAGRVQGLAVHSRDEPALSNVYGVIPVKGQDEAGARAFAAWLTGPRGQAAIAEFRIAGQQVFFPAAPPQGGS